MIAEGTLPAKFTEPLTHALTQRGISDARIVRHSAGKQGSCFIIDGGAYDERFVLKAMSPSRPSNSPDSVEREYRALERFYESSRVDPDVGAPEPLELFREQLGYLMGYVDGMSIEYLLEEDLLSERDIQKVAERIVHALKLYHRSVDEMYGDFHPLNVLIRPSLQVILIDPTPTSPFQQLVGDGDRYSPVSVDLGYWTYSVAARSVKQSLRGSKLPARLYRLTSEIMARASRAYPEEDVDEFHDAIYEAAGRYMLRLKSQPRLKDKVLGPLAQSRLKALKSQSRAAMLTRSGRREQPHISM